MNWKNVGTNLGALLVLAQTVYPGLNGEMIMTALLDGTWMSAAINIALAYYLYRDGKNENPRP